MNDDELWAAIDAQRRATNALLESLSDAEWRTPSLCEGWTVRDVAAHLTLQELTLPAALGLMLRFPGPMNRLIREAAKRRAARSRAELLRELRAMVGRRRHNVGVTAMETLVDALVHGQDIAIPLDRRLEMATVPAAWAAQRVWSTAGGAAARVFDGLPLGDLCLVADDVDWAEGSGAEVRGPIASPLLLLTGRRAALRRVAGPGADVLVSRLGPPRRRWTGRPLRNRA